MTKSKSDIIEDLLKVDPSYTREELNKLPVHKLLVLRDSLKDDSSSSESDSDDISTLKSLRRFKIR